jgi:hypothetical protein
MLGIIRTQSINIHPHPNLPPSRGKEFVILSFAKDLLFGFDLTRVTADSSLSLRMTGLLNAPPIGYFKYI